MPYVLGLDIGSTSTVATVARRRDDTWARPEVVRLGVDPAVPSVLHLAADGALVIGEPATDDDSRTTRDFVHRIGDDVPLLLGGEPCPPETLVAELAAWVVERVSAREGGLAEAVVLSHPAGWGAHRRDLLHRALGDLGLDAVTLLPRPVTVAETHAARGFPGATAAVYALGGNTFEAALVRRTPHGTYGAFGLPQALEPVGGADFTEALAEHVRAVLRREFGGTDPHVPARELRAECERAKRELTVATQADVLLALPAGPVRVPVTRTQFEDLIRPAARATVDLLLRTTYSAGLAPAQLDGVLLAGGSARIPLVAELLTAALPAPVEVEPDPGLTAATGAALAATQVVSPRPRRPAPVPGSAPVSGAGAAVPAQRPAPQDHSGPGTPPPRPPVRVAPLHLPKASRLALARGRGRNR